MPHPAARALTPGVPDAPAPDASRPGAPDVSPSNIGPSAGPGPVPRRRAGGRSARVRAAVLDAAAALLVEQGLDGVSIAAVAARAGVHETSVYRRWGTRAALVADAGLALVGAAIPIPDTGALRTDLDALAAGASAFLASPPGIALTSGLPAAPGEPGAPGAVGDDWAAARRAYWAERLAAVGQVFSRAAARGEAAPTLDPALAVELLLGPLYFRRLVSGEPLDGPFLAAVAAAVARAVAPPPDTSARTP